MTDDELKKDASDLAGVEGSAEAQGAEDQGKTVIISRRKLEANRRNGAKGGVKTEEGKLKSRRNAFQHGMRATTLLIENEGQGYRELREALEREYKPRTTTECMLMDKMALAILRTRSGRAHEQHELAMESPFQFPAIDRLVRYATAADKLFFKALAELEKLRKEDVNEAE